MTRHDELVEEIATIITGNTGLALGSALLMAKLFIASTLKAVVDGGLKLPGQFRRYTLEGDFEDFLGHREGDIIIVVRKEEEEDGNTNKDPTY